MARTKYLWDDETDTVVMEKDGNGVTQAVYNSDPVPYGRLFSMRRNNKTHNYQYDAQGNTRTLTNETGQITDTYNYDAFGNQIAHTGTTINPYRFGGQHGYQYNEATEDYYVRTPTYEPKQGRWTSKKPVRFAKELNPYIYAGNGLANAADQSGMARQMSQFIAAFQKNPFGEIKPGANNPLSGHLFRPGEKLLLDIFSCRQGFINFGGDLKNLPSFIPGFLQLAGFPSLSDPPHCGRLTIDFRNPKVYGKLGPFGSHGGKEVPASRPNHGFTDQILGPRFPV